MTTQLPSPQLWSDPGLDVQYLRRPVEEPRGSRARPGVRLREPDSQQQLAAAVQVQCDMPLQGFVVWATSRLALPHFSSCTDDVQ